MIPANLSIQHIAEPEETLPAAAHQAPYALKNTQGGYLRGVRLKADEIEIFS